MQRIFFRSQYISTRCKNETGAITHCPFGDACRLAHNQVEQTFHPMRYKKEVCSISAVQGNFCNRANFCPYIHPGKLLFEV